MSSLIGSINDVNEAFGNSLHGMQSNRMDVAWGMGPEVRLVN